MLETNFVKLCNILEIPEKGTKILKIKSDGILLALGKNNVHSLRYDGLIAADIDISTVLE